MDKMEKLDIIADILRGKRQDAKEHLKSLERALTVASEVTNDKDAIKGICEEMEKERRMIEAANLGLHIVDAARNE